MLIYLFVFVRLGRNAHGGSLYRGDPVIPVDYVIPTNLEKGSNLRYTSSLLTFFFSHCLVINADLGRVRVRLLSFFNHVLFNCILSPLMWMFSLVNILYGCC